MRSLAFRTRIRPPLVVLGLLAILGCRARAQEHHHPPGSAAPSGYQDIDPHMRVTVKPPARPGDLERADRIVGETRRIIERFQDHRVALRENYKPFLIQLPLPEYHFTNYAYGFEAAFRFNIEHPTSLLYAREGDGYRLTGVMFTAPARATLEDLDDRVPLSVAQWHLHTNICLPPPDRRGEALRRNARFGLAGSISTEEECRQEDGRFLPRLFGWMVHVYPYEKHRERQFAMPGHHGHDEDQPPEDPAHGGTHRH